MTNKASTWWGYAKKYGWVYLDRSIQVNQPSSNRLLFVRCDNNSVFELQKEFWHEPDFYFEGRIEEFASHTNRFKDLLNTLYIYKNNENQYKGILNTQNRTRRSSQMNEAHIAAKDTGLKGGRPVTEKKIMMVRTPEQLKVELSHDKYFNRDEVWEEIIRYCAWMKSHSFGELKDLNNYITQNGLWGEFKSIRAMNDHGYSSQIEGISPKAYGAVCKLLKLLKGAGNPLISSQRY